MPYPVSNILIDALPEEMRRKLIRQLRHVPLPVLASLYEAGGSPKHVHFLTSGIASIVTEMADGNTTEVGTVGREGMPQALHLLGPAGVPTRCFMQIAGTGYRMNFKAFERLYAEEEAVRNVVLAYSQYHCLMLSQIAACNRLHDVEARLARWFLIIQDRTGEPVLKLTQEFLAQMIGSRRTTVSAVAGALQERGLIVYSRGKVRILDRRDLEKASCECYETTRNLLRSLYESASQKLFDESRSAAKTRA